MSSNPDDSDSRYNERMELEAALAELGLTSHEARVLAAVVRASPASASAIAKTTGIARSSVYTTLDALVAKGLVGTSFINEVKQFTSSGHEALMDLLIRQRDEAASRVTSAESLCAAFEGAPTHQNVPRIVFFEGQQGLQRVYLQMLREARDAGPMLILRDEFVWTDAWSFIHEPAWRERVATLKAQRDLRTRLLVNDTELEQSKREYYASRRATDTRYLPSGITFERYACYVLNDVVSLLSFDAKSMVGIRMSNPALANAFRVQFEALWALSR